MSRRTLESLISAEWLPIFADDALGSGWNRETRSVARCGADNCFRVVRIPPEANASVNISRLIVTYLAAERSMTPFRLARLHYLRNRVDDCRLLRKMDVVVGA